MTPATAATSAAAAAPVTSVMTPPAVTAAAGTTSRGTLNSSCSISSCVGYSSVDWQTKTELIAWKYFAYFTPLQLHKSFGPAGVPSYFQTEMTKIFKDFEYVVVNIDDILIGANDDDEMLDHLRAVFAKFREYNIWLSLAKCEFFMTEIKWLGRIISGKEIHVAPESIQGILPIAPLKNLKEYWTWRRGV